MGEVKPAGHGLTWGKQRKQQHCRLGRLHAGKQGEAAGLGLRVGSWTRCWAKGAGWLACWKWALVAQIGLAKK